MDLGGAHLPGMAQVMEVDEAADPHHVRALRFHAAVPVANIGSDLFEQAWRRRGCVW